jgi:hypothetical protein
MIPLNSNISKIYILQNGGLLINSMQLQHINTWIDKNGQRTVILLWLFFSIIWYVFFGFNFQLEGEKYGLEADYFTTHGHFSQARYLFYSSTILIIVMAKSVFQDLHYALFLLLGINLFCYLRFYKSLTVFFLQKQYALAIIIFLLAFWPFQSWTMYLYTENIFYSLILLLFAQILQFKRLTALYLAQLGLILLLLLISRPFGILFIFPVFLFLFFRATKKTKWILALGSMLGLFIFYRISQVVFTTTPDWTVQRSFLEENLICDIPTTKGNSGLDTIQSNNQLKALFYYITHNFGHFTGLALARLRLFFLLIRDYYSPLHNIFLLMVVVPVYVIFAAGFSKIRKKIPLPLLVFMLSVIVIFAASIAMQCDDYHNRFFLCLLPFFIFMNMVVLQEWRRYFFRKTQ